MFIQCNVLQDPDPAPKQMKCKKDVNVQKRTKERRSRKPRNPEIEDVMFRDVKFAKSQVI